MKIEQLYTDCLSEAAYYIESDGEVAIIDPLRDPEPYIKMAKKNGARIKYILETHFHADFVSGHLDLAKATGAKIVFGPTAQAAYDIYVAKDGEKLSLGSLEIEVLHTPGHTMESSCFLVEDPKENITALFSGDTLFIGDVGRPDLAVNKDLSKEDLAGYLFDSLRNKIIPLHDNVIIYPGHGAGSACGKNMSQERHDTLGHQKKTNYALQSGMDKAEFVKKVIDGIKAPPAYFPKNAMLNKNGYDSFALVLERSNKALDANAFSEAMKNESVLILDVRSSEAFLEAHIPGALFVGLDGRFANWVGSLVKELNTPILLVCEEGQATEAIGRLSRIAYDGVLAYLKGGMKAWIAAGKETINISSISAEELFLNSDSILFDVRHENEFGAEHVLGAVNMPLENLSEQDISIPKNKNLYLYCKSGYRSTIAASILKNKGFIPININGGFEDILKSSLSISSFVCPNKNVK